MCWQLEARSLIASQRGSMEARSRDQQVLECTLNEQKETTLQLLQNVTHEAEENQVARGMAPQQVAHTQSDARELAHGPTYAAMSVDIIVLQYINSDTRSSMKRRW